jgi:DNA-directed RNA polymerase specialized sigma24 family protein
LTRPPDADPRRGIADAVVIDLLANGRAEALVGQLRRDYGDLSWHRLQDAVTDGFVALYQKLLGQDVVKPLAFVYKVARNTLNKELERTPTFVSLPDDDAPDALSSDLVDSAHDEVRALRREHALRYLLGVIDSWTNANVKQVTRLVIESAMRGEPLESTEIGDRLGLNPGSVKVWRQRGLDRLAAHVHSLGLELADFDDELVVADEDTEEEGSRE